MPRPLLPNENGKFVPTVVTVHDALRVLDKVFSNREQGSARQEGLLTRFLKSVDPNSEIDPLLCIAIYSARTVTGQDTLTERPLAELSIMAQAKTNFLYNHSDVVSVNSARDGFMDHNSYRLSRQMAKRMVDAFYASGLIKITDTVIDVGTGYGSVAKYLKKKGIDTTAIEPFFEELHLQGILDAKAEQGKLLKESKRKELDGIIRMTAEKYVANNPGKKFSVVNVSNFYPYTDGWDMTAALAAMTKKDGKALIGVCCVDPQDVSNTPHNIKRHLERHFGKVRYIPAQDVSQSEFDEYFSVGGQIGFFECTRPGTPDPDEEECVVM